jgi:hypothetical protein
LPRWFYSLNGLTLRPEKLEILAGLPDVIGRLQQRIFL